MFGWIKESAVYEAGLIGSSSWDEESSSYKVQLPAEVLQEAARVMDKGYLFYVHGTIEAEGTESEFYLRANKMDANRILFAEGSSLTESLLTISYFDLTHVETEVTDLMNDVTDLQTAFKQNVNNRLTALDGERVIDTMEIGSMAFSSSAISWNTANNRVRIPSSVVVNVSKGDVIHLIDNTVKFIYSVQTGESTYSYSNTWRTADFVVPNDGRLYLVVAYADDSPITNVADLSQRVRIIKAWSESVKNTAASAIAYEFLMDNGHMDAADFGVGTYGAGIYNPTFRTYRASTTRTLLYTFNLDLIASDGYRFAVHTYSNGAWSSSDWVTRYTVPSGTPFGMLIGKVTEDTSSTADVPTFVANIKAYTDYEKHKIVDVDTSACETHMSHFYNSINAESYAFFTDPHLMGQAGEFDASNFDKYIKILKATVDSVSCSYVVSGGDWLNREDSKAQASTKLGYVDGKMRTLFPDKYFPIVGNHDFNYIGYEDGTRLPESQWISNSAMRNYWFHDHDQCYYKFKRMTAQNYVLNTRTDYNGTNSYDKTMLDWLAANLIEDDAPHSTIMFHIYFLSAVETTIPTRVVAIGKIIAAFNAHSTCVLTNDSDGYDKTYDFTGTTGHIDYVIVGHTHADFSDTFGGVPVVGCDNFTEGNVATFDMVFADYTNHKLYLTRFGSGESREFDI